MRRIKLVLAALAVMVAIFAAFAAPAMAANNNTDCRNVPGPDVRCDGTYYAPADNYRYNDWNPYWYGYYPFNYDYSHYNYDYNNYGW